LASDIVAPGNAAAVGVGFYEFVPIQDGKPVPRPARFIMIVVKRGADRLTIHHHSSPRCPAFRHRAKCFRPNAWDGRFLRGC
jgi:hypothetical protein